MNSSFFDASAAAANNTTDEAQDMFEDFSEEVRNIINEMGYDVEEDVLHEIEKDLRLLEENADVADRKLFSCLLDNFDGFPTSASDLDLSLQNLTNMVATSSQQAGQSEIPREFDELITHGYERLQEVYMDIKRYERLLEEGQTGPGTMRNRQREDAQNEDVEDEEDEDDGSLPSSQQEFARKQRQQPHEKEKENVRFVDEEPVKIDPKKEKQLINRFLRANALRATKCPEPGRLPFKHDHQLRLEQYRREWAKLPPPGEQKRMALRWRIRELMLQREIPHLRLISEDAIQVEVEEQPPVVKMTRKSHWKP